VRWASPAASLNGRPPQRLYTVRDGLPSPFILRVFQDSRGDIWAGTAEGVARWDRAADRWQSYAAAGHDAVHSFAEDRSGAVWVGLHRGRLLRFRGSSLDSFTDHLPRGGMNALLCDHEGRLWIGSSQGGIARLDEPSAAAPRFALLGLAEGLSSEHVFDLAEDTSGRIYIATGRGVDRVEPGAATWRHFGSSNGLPPGQTEALFRDRQGDIWFASLFGLSRYHPEPDRTDPPPAPLLRTLRIAGRPYPISELGQRSLGGLKFSADQGNLEIEFRALHFATDERLSYQYRLDGADAGWSAPSDLQTVRYASLAPGRYRFIARTLTDSGRISSGVANIEFRILPPFWRRGWFLIAITVVSFIGMVSLHRYRVWHLLAMERVRTRLATDLHDELGAGLAEIAILSEVAKRERDTPATRTLDRIADLARNLRGAMSDIVWTVDPSEDHLLNLVMRMRETAFSLLESDSRRVEFIAPREDDSDMQLPPDLRRHSWLVFKEGITNVARHSAATAVRIEVSVGSGILRLVIRDNGRGFEPTARRRGKGINSMHYRSRELNAQLRLFSATGKGTEIELEIPLK
jgi:hypothetical protein